MIFESANGTGGGFARFEKDHDVMAGGAVCAGVIHVPRDAATYTRGCKNVMKNRHWKLKRRISVFVHHYAKFFGRPRKSSFLRATALDLQGGAGHAKA
jgi:hypothetical protein